MAGTLASHNVFFNSVTCVTYAVTTLNPSPLDLIQQRQIRRAELADRET